jgi:hypothetical protein
MIKCTTFPILSGYVDKVDLVHVHRLPFFGKNHATSSKPILVGNQIMTTIHFCMGIFSIIAILISIYVVLIFYTNMWAHKVSIVD